jgi:glutamyl-tRNA(Gln) amidotransferase subunit D
MDVYSTGRDLQRRGVIPLGDVTPETAFAKLCWALGNASSREEAAAWMQADQVGESSPRSVVDTEVRHG